MNYRSYSLNVILRILLLAGAMLGFFYSIHQNQWYVTSVVSALLIVILIFSLIRYTYNFRKELSDFLLAIKNKEYNQYQKSRMLKKHPDIQYAFDIIAKELQTVNIEQRSHYDYLQALVENINTGIISFKENGEIHLFNKAALQLLDIPLPNNINTLKNYHSSLYKEISNITPGERILFKLNIEDETRPIAIRSKEFKLKKDKYKLFSLYDIRSELDAQELESYQKLIQVLRHEIMNSATPISSLTDSVKESIEEILERKSEIDPDLYDELKDLLMSTQTINTRTKGLLQFIQKYRKLTNIPKPQIEKIDLKEVLNHSIHLLNSNLEENSVEVENLVDEDPLFISGDFDQVEQVIINILLNAIEAIAHKGTPKINIHSLENESQIKLFIKDNGEGISDEGKSKIFIPFFTTKKEGSGIGLSLSRQIMKLHNGNILLHTQKEKGTTCELQFQK